MFFQSKLFKVLLPFFAYLLFIWQWLLATKAFWYNNIPEETVYLKEFTIPTFYTIYVYLFAGCFLLFIVLGLIYLAQQTTSKYIVWSLLAVLIFSVFYVWRFSVAMEKYYSMPLMAVNLAIFIIAIFKLYRK